MTHLGCWIYVYYILFQICNRPFDERILKLVEILKKITGKKVYWLMHPVRTATDFLKDKECTRAVTYGRQAPLKELSY